MHGESTWEIIGNQIRLLGVGRSVFNIFSSANTGVSWLLAFKVHISVGVGGFLSPRFVSLQYAAFVIIWHESLLYCNFPRVRKSDDPVLGKSRFVPEKIFGVV